MKIVFIISLPRSGSTLLQRILSSSKEIKTTPENWILLHLFNVYHSFSTSIYSDYLLNVALKENNNSLHDDFKYDQFILNYAKGYYNSLVGSKSPEAFIDKTPRYYLIHEDILRVFGEENVICLIRNPRDIVMSILSTWHFKSLILLHTSQLDLHTGVSEILNFSTKCKPANIVRYEDVVMKKINNLLGFDLIYEDIGLIKGHLGDKTGQEKFGKSINDQNSKTKYVSTFTRYFIVTSFINRFFKMQSKINASYYTKDMCKVSIRKYNPFQEIVDLVSLSCSHLIRIFNLGYFFNKNMKKFRFKYLD